MKRYKFSLKEFISQNEIEDKFREIAKEKFEILIIDFSNLKTVDKVGFKSIINLQKAFKLMGKEVYFCCIPSYIAYILSKWDYKFEVIFDDK